MPDLPSLPPAIPHPVARWLTLGLVVAALLGFVGTVTSGPTGATGAPLTGNPDAVAAQATSPVGQNAGPRLQPVGNGDTIASPVDPSDDSGDRDGSWWWRVVFGAAVVVVVLVALVQRRGTPDHARGAGGRGGPRHRGNDRNALGH